MMREPLQKNAVQQNDLPDHSIERVPSRIIEAPRTSGNPLNSETRHFMEQRFAHDFSKVRVHTDEQSQRSASTLNARAFTIGNNIVFGSGEYIPGTERGKSLIAHELAHVIQQHSVPVSVQKKLKISSPTDSAEQAADAAAHMAMDSSNLYSSTALQIRDQLRAIPSPQLTVQRAVKTWGGEFDTDKYELTKNPGMDGVDIVLRFKPGKNVNAELIGMTQTARSLIKGAPVPTSGFGPPNVAKALKDRTIPLGQTGAGTRIDRISTHGNPLYATDKPSAGDALADTPTVAFWGRHGWRYTNKAGKLQKQDALLKDTPQLLSKSKESSQTFETTALAVKGVQEGTFYGSVQWGWEKDAAGKVKKLPLSLVSRGVPSATFGRASELWNQKQTSEGKETIDLPVVDVKVISQDDVKIFSNPIDAMIELSPGTPLPRGTRIRILDASDILVHKVEIVDGPMTGRRGYIIDLRSYRNER